MIKKEAIGINTAGLIQGISLVAFPAVSTILTNPHDFNFTATQYGSLFIPQSLLSILAAACNPSLSRRLGSKEVFVIGLIANIISMVLLTLSVTIMHYTSIVYIVLLVATGFLGLGFGLVVPSINAMTALLYPQKIDTAILFLNALLGIGTALAPLFISIFVAFGFWWGLPALLSVSLLLLLFFCLPLPLPGGKISVKVTSKQTIISSRFIIFAALALLYGIVETIKGNWISIYMQEHLHVDIKMQSLALTAFWGMVTFGRIFFAAMKKYFSEQLAFQISPFVSSFAFIVIAILPPGADYWAIIAFGLIGFGCAVMLPLIISFGTQQLQSIAASVPGIIISCYLLGYGIAAFGVGFLLDVTHIDLRAIYATGAAIAFILGIISIFIMKNRSRICK